MYSKIRRAKRRKTKREGKVEMGIKVKHSLGCPIHLLGVDHKFVPELSHSQSEKETVSVTQLQVSMRLLKRIYYSRELLLLVLKSGRNFS